VTIDEWETSRIEEELLVVSQFTLHASTNKGSRPSFLRAAGPERVEQLYEQFCLELEIAADMPVSRGVFGVDIEVGLLNDGPYTIQIDSRKRE
jgi:D-tyrosyl-tRNA(Tyr) deacylase